MTEILNRVLSLATLRNAMKQKRQAGVSNQTISRLIACYVSADAAAECEDGLSRLPVELIHPGQRLAFLEALQRLPTGRRTVMGETPPQDR